MVYSVTRGKAQLHAKAHGPYRLFAAVIGRRGHIVLNTAYHRIAGPAFGCHRRDELRHERIGHLALAAGIDGKSDIVDIFHDETAIAGKRI